MNKTIKFLLASLMALCVAPAFAQTSLTQTTLGTAVTSVSARTLSVASATGIVAPSASGSGSVLYIDNEALSVTAVSGTYISVLRGALGTPSSTHVSGAMVLIGPPQAFIQTPFDPSGSCTNGQGIFLYSPVVNVRTGNEWLCSTVTNKVVPGFSNVAGIPQVTTAVASAAGLVTPSGPLFHITGIAAITGFNIPVGFDPKEGGTICAIPDGLFTTTNANNFAIASTAVVSKTLCWTYDANTAKFYPSY